MQAKAAPVASSPVVMTARMPIRRIGVRAVITTGLLATGAAFACVGLFHDQTWQLYAATTVQGLGSGMVFSSLAGVVVAAVPPEQTGVASGMNANIRTIGGSIGSAAMAGILTAHVGASGFPAERGYEIGFVMLGAVMALASIAAILIPETHHQESSGHLADAADGELGLLPAALATPVTGAAPVVRP